MKRNLNTDEATALFESVTSNKPTPVVGLWVNRILNLADEKMAMGADMTSQDTLQAVYDMCADEVHLLGYILGDGSGWNLEQIWQGTIDLNLSAYEFLVEYATELGVAIMAKYILVVQAQSMEVFV